MKVQRKQRSLGSLATLLNKKGATATEYIIVLILIACVVILTVRTYGSTVKTKFDQANTRVAKKVKFN